MGENKKDVKDESSEEESSPPTDSEEEDVDSDSDEENDKSKNFSELRKKTKLLEEENKDLKKEKEEKEEGERSLDKEEKDKEEKEDKEESPNLGKTLFNRDMKKAVRNWNSKNSVSKDEWAKIKDKVTFEGNEDDDEIYQKIDDAYNNLPGVREKREKELVDKGKKEAMNQFQDSELDIGSGGDIDHGESSEPRFNTKEKTWLKSFGVTKEEQKKIDRSSDSYNDWEILDPEYKE